jgi:processive 1,2-diacylglycerol beta-glucosyltransferase
LCAEHGVSFFESTESGSFVEREGPVIQVYDKNTRVMLGTITQEQLKFLVAQLEEESTTDQDYYIDTATIEMLQTAGADPDLLQLLQDGLGDRTGIEILWEEDEE